MIKSCVQCRKSCCKTGPGPYKEVTPAVYLKNFGNVESYNTKCKGLTGNKCSLWLTAKLPSNCRIYICHNRAYSKKELDTIKHVIGNNCPRCGAKYMINRGRKWVCEICGRR